MDATSLIIGFAVGLLLGLVAAFSWCDRRGRARAGETQTRLALAEQRGADLAAGREAALAELSAARDAHSRALAAEQRAGDLDQTLTRTRDELAGQRARSEQALATLRETATAEVLTLRERKEADLADAATRAAALREQLATAAAQLEAERASLAEQRKFVEESAKRLREAFAQVSDDTMARNNARFLELADAKFKTLAADATGSLEQRKTEIAALMQPLQQKLEEYRAGVAGIEQKREAAYTTLATQLASVAKTQELLGGQTGQLVAALRKPQGRGRWGELTLRRLFELAQLVDRVSFSEQVSVEGGDGQQKRPDCIVQLPEGRQVIIDSKAVIDAFLDAAESSDEGVRQGHLKRHGRQVRNRMEELANKAYWSDFAQATEYVVLFLPGEAFLYAAVEQDPTLIEDALARKVIIASPTSLLGLLRVIEFGWRQKVVEENAAEIREMGEELYKRVATMAGHFEKLGGALNTATAAYNNTLGSLERNVFSQAKRMAELKVRAREPIEPPQPLDEAARQLSPKWGALPGARDGGTGDGSSHGLGLPAGGGADV